MVIYSLRDAEKRSLNCLEREGHPLSAADAQSDHPAFQAIALHRMQ
jgi:hypothetical protein